MVNIHDTVDTVKTYQDNIKLSFVAIREWYYKTSPESRDELLGEARIGLWKAVLSYDKSKGTEFSTYAYACIRSNCAKFIRKIMAQKRKPLFSDVSLSTPKVISDGGNIITLEDMLSYDVDYENKLILKDILKEIKSDNVLNLRYNYGLTQTQIAKRTGFSQAQISRLIRKKTNELKEKYDL